ncbi:unnamed protein product [Ambrosiozyma monospora]|uniref:Unnamed protein product n=1 Tax=Ambrosiozyma monospora TaxID=43982 RepID=A0ACB5U3T9_AMBMO|nr:unnamed protein product [Ambrosiozyma monospora]
MVNLVHCPYYPLKMNMNSNNGTGSIIHHFNGNNNRVGIGIGISTGQLGSHSHSLSGSKTGLVGLSEDSIAGKYTIDSPTVTGTCTALGTAMGTVIGTGTGGTGGTASGASGATTSSTGDFNSRSMFAEQELKRILGNGKDTLPLRNLSAGNGEFAEESASLARFFERSVKDSDECDGQGPGFGGGRAGRGRSGRSLSFAFGGGR